MSKFAIISDAEKKICEKFIQLGYELICTESVDEFISYEKKHADMQCAIINDEVFVLSTCDCLYIKLSELGLNVHFTSNKFTGKYPENILLNIAVVGKSVIGKIDKLDAKIIDYCKKYDYSSIDVKQGYAGCSCLVVDENSIITADKSIYNAAINNDIEVLLIEEGHIKLSGAGENVHGFIGGASVMLDNENVLFFGEIDKHPDYYKIKEYLELKNVKIHTISDLELTDIGSVRLLKV